MDVPRKVELPITELTKVTRRGYPWQVIIPPAPITSPAAAATAASSGWIWGAAQ